jgi:hypothetical protein
VHRARDLVDILTARALRPDRGELDFGWIDRYRHSAPVRARAARMAVS